MTALPVTVSSLPQCCEVCSDSKRPGLMVVEVVGSDHQVLAPCPHCAGAECLRLLLEGKQ